MMRRRAFIASVGAVSIAGCSAHAQQDPVTETTTIEEPTIMYQSSWYDWETGRRYVSVEIQLNDITGVQVRDADKRRITTSGEFTFQLPPNAVSLEFDWETGSETIQNVPPTPYRRRSQPRFVAWEFSNQYQQTAEYNIEKHIKYEGQISSVDTVLSIPVSLLTYYRQLPKVDSYTAYCTTPYDDSLLYDIESACIPRNGSLYEQVCAAREFAHSLQDTQEFVYLEYDSEPRYLIETLFDGGGSSLETSILVGSLLSRVGYDIKLVSLPRHIGLAIKTENENTTYADGYEYVEPAFPYWEIGRKHHIYKDEDGELLPFSGGSHIDTEVTIDNSNGGAPITTIDIDAPGTFTNELSAVVSFVDRVGRIIEQGTVEFMNPDTESYSPPSVLLPPPARSVDIKVVVEIYHGDSVISAVSSHYKNASEVTTR